MKPKPKHLGRKLLSVFTAVSLLAAIVSTPVSPSMTANAGATINILTGSWGAVAMEYLERGILRTIGSAAAHAENEAVADILTTTKKFLASPMSSTLGDIKKMCAQMNAKLDNISKMMSNNQQILESKLDAVTEQQLKDNYTAQKSKLDTVKNVYANVINLFHNLNNAAQNVDVNNQDSIKALSTAYDSLNDIYEAANGITTHTGLEFNFSTDANTIAGIISAYPYSAGVDYNVDPSDKSVWNENGKSDVPTMIDYYYQSLKYSDAFDHEYYRDMSAQYTYAAGVVSNYLEAYNLYVSYASQLIYSGNAAGITDDRDKQRMVDKLWEGYNKECYVLLRALSQMMDGYDSKLSGVMREYDINTVIHFDNIKESINSGGVYEERMNDRKESKRNKTSKRMQAYQMRPFGSTTAYALRKTNSSQPAILMDDLSYYAFDIRVMSFPFYQNDCTGPTCDYRNLVDYAATSPTYWYPLSKNTQLDGLVNTTAFEKVTNQGNPSYMTNYLKAHGMTADLPKMDSSNKWALSNQYDWNYDSDGYVGNWDIDMQFYTVNTLKKGTSMSTEKFDMESVPDERKGKEVSIFYTGEPQVAVYLPSNGGADYQYSAVDYKGNAASANGGRNVYRSGGTITLKIKPNEGKYIKSLRLCDRFVYDEDHSKGTLTQYVSEDDELYKADCGVYPDTDGYYTFKINVPFRDGSVILDLGDIPSKVHTVSLAESEDVVSGSQYDKDGGIAAVNNGTIDHCLRGVNIDSTVSVYGKNGQKIRPSQYNSYVNGKYAGGIAATNNGKITGTRNGAVVFGEWCGGICADNAGTIYGSANNGAVGRDSVSVNLCGGFTAKNSGIIDCCYNSGKPMISSAQNTTAAAGMIAALNESNSISNTFCNSINAIPPIGSGDITDPTGMITVITNTEMLESTFADTLNAVTDETVQWVQKIINGTYLNSLYPVILGNFLKNRTMTLSSGITLKGLMHEQLNVSYDKAASDSDIYNAFNSALPNKKMTVYTVSCDDGNGGFIPEDYWCSGVSISVPVDSNDVSFAVMGSDGIVRSVKAESIVDGVAAFSAASPVSFAVVSASSAKTDDNKTSKSDVNNSSSVQSTGNGSVQTGEAQTALIAIVLMVISAATAVLLRRKKNRE